MQDLELLAIMYALRVLRHYLIGQKFDLKTDHCGLQHIFTQSDLNTQQRRWSELLSEYDFDISYIKGTVNRVVDALSQRPRIFSMIPLQTNLRENILAIQIDDDWYKEVQDNIRKDTMMVPKFEGYTLDNDGLVRYNNKIYIPPNDELINLILSEAHRAVYMAHPGVMKMRENLKPLFFWKGMKEDIVSYVARCLEWKQVKVEHRHPTRLLQPHANTQLKWEVISMEFIVGLSVTTRRNDLIFVVVDTLTKSANFNPVHMTYTVPDIAIFFVSDIVILHGVPKRIISDRGSVFTGHFWTSFQEALGMQLNFSTTYHPETDGRTERTNQILEDMLRMYVMDKKRIWEEFLPLVEFAYNNSYQSTIKMAPFEFLYGRSCRMPLSWDRLEERVLVRPEAIQEMEEQMQSIRQRIKEAQDWHKSYVDSHRVDHNYEVGDRVFLRVKPHKSLIKFGKGAKLSPRFVGPFEVVERKGPVAYRLALPDSLRRMHNVFMYLF
jgi:transposase InsO family protein